MSNHGGVDSIFGQENKLEEKRNSHLKWSQKRNERLERIKRDSQKRVEVVNPEMDHFYHKAIPILLKEALRLLETVPETPFELFLLRHNGGSYKGTEQYSRFLIQKYCTRIIYIPETYNWHDGTIVWYDHKRTMSLEEILNNQDTKAEDLKSMYLTLKNFINQYQPRER